MATVDLTQDEVQRLEADYQDDRLSPAKRQVWGEVRQHYLNLQAPMPERPEPPQPEQGSPLANEIELIPQPPGSVRVRLESEPEPPTAALGRKAWEFVPSAPAVPESRLAPDDPRRQSPFYMQAWENLKERGLPVFPYQGSGGMLPVDPNAPPGQQTDQLEEQRRAYAWWVRQGLEWAPTLVAMATNPTSVAPGAYRGFAAVLNEFGRPVMRALHMYLGQNIAERVANAVDPYRYTPPEEAAFSQAVGEAVGNIGGRAVDMTARGLGRAREAAFGATPWGRAHQGVITDLGAEVTPGMVSEKMWPRTMDVVMSHAPLTFRVSRRYERAQEVLEEELQRLRARHPGTAVTASGDVLRQQALGRSTPGLLETAPELMRTTLSQRIAQEQTRIKNNFTALDQNYLQRSIPWHFGKARLPYVTQAEDLLASPALAPLLQGPDNMFQNGVQLIKSLEALPDQIPLQQALYNQRAVSAAIDEALAHVQAVRAGRLPQTALSDSVQNTLLPALGQAQQQIVEQIGPFLVDLRPAKAHAAQLLRTYEAGLRVPEASLLGGQAGRQAFTEDPHILAARGLLEQENFVLFGDAHQMRSQLLEISRLPGPIIGNTVARQGKEMADLVEAQMRVTGDRLHPSLLPQWEHASREWAQVANAYNSDLITRFHGMNLDDILTRLIQSERPNDFKALREVLGKDAAGNEVFETAAQMWLTRQIEAAKLKAGEAGRLDVDELVGRLNSMTMVAEKELFPRGLTDLRRQLWQVKHMDEAVQVAEQGQNVLALQKLKTSIGDPARWQDVQSDVISHMLSGGVDPIKGGTMLEHLNRLTPVKDVLFDAPQWTELTRLAHTSRMVQETLKTHGWHWTPAMRFLEHGGVIVGLHLLGANPYLAGGLVLSSAGLARLMTMPKVVRALSEGMSMPVNTQRASELLGMVIGQIEAQGLQKDVSPLPPSPHLQPETAPTGR